MRAARPTAKEEAPAVTTGAVVVGLTTGAEGAPVPVPTMTGAGQLGPPGHLMLVVVAGCGTTVRVVLGPVTDSVLITVKVLCRVLVVMVSDGLLPEGFWPPGCEPEGCWPPGCEPEGCWPPGGLPAGWVG